MSASVIGSHVGPHYYLMSRYLEAFGMPQQPCGVQVYVCLGAWSIRAVGVRPGGLDVRAECMTDVSLVVDLAP